jgi:hypothetical protein
MCGGEHAERTVLRCRIIEVDSQSHNLGESICWSVCVDDAIFYRPRSPALRFLLISKRQGEQFQWKLLTTNVSNKSGNLLSLKS